MKFGKLPDSLFELRSTISMGASQFCMADMSPEIMFLLKSIITQLRNDVGNVPDKLLDESFKYFKLVELTPGSEPVHKQKKKKRAMSKT